MHQKRTERSTDLDPQETSEWLEALDQVLEDTGPTRASYLLEQLTQHARSAGIAPPIQHNTPYVNTIAVGISFLIRATAHWKGASRA